MADDASSVFQLLNEACLEGEVPLTVLSQQLGSLGAYRGLGRDNAIAKYSLHVLDALPRIHGAATSAGDQLAEKLATHSLLLQCLADANALQQLHASVLRCLFEDGQRLAALADVQQVESEQQRGGAGAALHDALLKAGRACLAAVAGAGDRDPWAVVFSCPTSSLTAVFQNIALAVASAGTQPGAAAADHHTVTQLSRALAAALGGALRQRSQQQQFFPAAVNAAVAGLDEPELAAQADVRVALAALADACCRLQPLLAREAPQLLPDSVLLLLDLTDRLLNAGAAAVAAAPLGQQRRHLHDEYVGVRGKLLATLLDRAVDACRKGAPDGEALLSRVRGLAYAHGGYPQLHELADITGDRPQLHGEMAQLRGDGLTPPLATYVFERLLAEGRRAELMDLPQQFDEELHRWLADAEAPDAPRRAELLWLHELRQHDYAGASATLAALAAEAGPEEAPRLSALQHLSALAAGGQ